MKTGSDCYSAHTEQRITDLFFLLRQSQLNNLYCNFLQQISRKTSCSGRCVSHALEKGNLDSLCPESEGRVIPTLGEVTCP